MINCEFAGLAQFVRENQVPIYTVGTGVGSPGFGKPEDTNCLDKWTPSLSGLTPLGVRGPLSQELLARAGLSDVEVIGDPALGLTPDTPPPFRSRERLIINLSQDGGTPYESGEFQIFHAVAELATNFLREGGEVVGVALGDHDRPILEAFRSKHRLTAMRIENHRLSSQQFFESVTGSFGLIGVRLHAAVLASCVGVPPILFAYRSKCQEFMSSMDLEDFALPLWPEVPPDRLRSWFERILAEPQLGVRLYQKALSWKRKQEVYYGKLRSRIQGGAKKLTRQAAL